MADRGTTKSLKKGLVVLKTLNEKDDVLRSTEPKEREAASKIKELEKEFQQIRRRGYGLREGGLIPKTGSIAVPIMYEGESLACLNLHYILSALSLKQVVGRYLATMQSAAKEIEKRLKKVGI
jgi:DNA-binding IclR family transcriptional regulator